MTSSHSNSLPADVAPLAGIVRCVRRICLLREQGNTADANRLEQNDLANAIRDLRLAHGPDTLPQAELQALFVAEERRVADAVILSELLIPQLVKSFPAAPLPQVQTRTATVATSSAEPATPFPRAAAAAGVSPIIADMLDAMLASERTGRRPLSPVKS